MSKSTSRRAGTEGKGSPLMVGLLLGLIVGVGIAAALAWYTMKTPSPFVSKQATASQAALTEQLKAAASEVTKQANAAVSSVTDAKPRFEFYKVLTDKQDAPSLPMQDSAKPVVNKPVAVAKTNTSNIIETPKPVTKGIYYLQAGAFANQAEAEKLKAGLLMDGMEVTVLAANIPDKGVFHRVRTGPYQSAEEMNKARAKLQLKGINSTPMRVQ